MEGIEKTLHDVLNIGLGAYGEATARVDAARAQVEASFGDLVARGAADKSETVEKLRTGLATGIARVNETRTKVQGALA